MAHHKRGKPKNARSGCLMCKAWKANGFAIEHSDGEAFASHWRRQVADEEVVSTKRAGRSLDGDAQG